MNSIVKLQLINTDTQKPIIGFDPLTTGAILNLATLSAKNFNINVITNPTTVGSVEFVLDQNKHIENFSPYSFPGDTNGVFNPFTLTLGAHTLKVTPFSLANASGVAGTPIEITFSVINTPVPPPPSTTIPAFAYNGVANIEFDGQNFTITIKGTIQS